VRTRPPSSTIGAASWQPAVDATRGALEDLVGLLRFEGYQVAIAPYGRLIGAVVSQFDPAHRPGLTVDADNYQVLDPDQMLDLRDPATL
jgi:hypothetical protein